MLRGAVSPRADRWAIAAITLFTLVFSAVGWLKYQSFAFVDFDLAVHAQTMWNLLHGSLESSILGVPFLGNHANLILFFLVPVYALARHPVTLLVVQAAASGWGGWVLYRLASRELPASMALAVLASYLLYPALGYANLFEFHPPVLSIPFILLAAVALRDRRAWACAGWGLAACLCQENLPLVIVPLGLYALLLRRPGGWVIGPLVGGGGYFVAMTGWLIPTMGRGTIDFLSLYRHLGATPVHIVHTLLTNPSAWVATLRQPDVGPYLLGLVGPLAGLPLLSPLPMLLLSGPSFVQHLFSARLAERTIYFHYTVEMIPGLFLSGLFGLQRFMRWRWCPFRPRLLAVVVASWAVGANLLLGPQLWLPRRVARFWPTPADRARAELVTHVPPAAGVVATFTWLPHLAHRPHLYSFHHWWMGYHTLSRTPYRLPADATIAVIDRNDPILFQQRYILPGFEDRVTWRAGFQSPEGPQRLQMLLGPSSGWRPVAHQGSTVIFERQGSGLPEGSS